MLLRTMLAAVTFGWLGVFGLGALLGEIRASGWLYAILGGVFGALFALATRDMHLGRAQAWNAARVCFVVAMALLVWGFVGLVLGSDPVTGEGFSQRGAALPGTIILLSAAPALGGLFLMAMRSR